jgi:hypothetical protein
VAQSGGALVWHDKRIRRGTFFSVEELEAAIEEYLEENNKQPKPFVWTATVEQILAKVNRCKAILETYTSKVGVSAQPASKFTSGDQHRWEEFVESVSD